jgi:ribosomal-protein-alanine N-acetyltransferase
MRPEDIPEVGNVERECFPTPWPAGAYRRELKNTVGNYYIVARYHAPDSPPALPTSEPEPVGRNGFNLFGFLQRPALPPHPYPLVGFAGMWVMMEEAHITTIGVASAHRRRHVGEMLLVGLVDEAIRRDANWITLEVRVSNLNAQNLYRKYGFSQYGIRKRYYSDNGEDAYIMWSPSLRTVDFQARYRLLRDELAEHLACWETTLPEGVLPWRPEPA